MSFGKAEKQPKDLQRVRVSILVLMDVVREAYNFRYGGVLRGTVSILVLMDVVREEVLFDIIVRPRLPFQSLF